MDHIGAALVVVVDEEPEAVTEAAAQHHSPHYQTHLETRHWHRNQRNSASFRPLSWKTHGSSWSRRWVSRISNLSFHRRTSRALLAPYQSQTIQKRLKRPDLLEPRIPPSFTRTLVERDERKTIPLDA